MDRVVAEDVGHGKYEEEGECDEALWGQRKGDNEVFHFGVGVGGHFEVGD